jgi:hypothetical protein
MVCPGKVDLIDRSIFFGPLVELHPTVLLGQLVYIAKEW